MGGIPLLGVWFFWFRELIIQIWESYQSTCIYFTYKMPYWRDIYDFSLTFRTKNEKNVIAGHFLFLAARSVIPIPTRGDKLCPPHYYWRPLIPPIIEI